MTKLYEMQTEMTFLLPLTIFNYIYVEMFNKNIYCTVIVDPAETVEEAVRFLSTTQLNGRVLGYVRILCIPITIRIYSGQLF